IDPLTNADSSRARSRCGELSDRVSSLAMRWLTATITVALLLGAAATPSAASSFDATVRSTPADNEGKADRAAERRLEKAAKSVKKQGGSVKQALAIVGAVSARLKGVQILKLTRDNDVDYVVKDQKLQAQFDPALDSAKAGSPGVLEVGAPQAWSQLGVTGRGVGVAVVDSGVYAH